MKIYQVTVRRSFNEHDGYDYYSNKTVAHSKQRNTNKESGNEDEVRELNLTLTKKGVLSFLNAHASYPDNG